MNRSIGVLLSQGLLPMIADRRRAVK